MSRIAKLPAGYRQVEYIQSNGEQCIDSGHIPQSENLRVVLDFLLPASPAGKTLFGTQVGSKWLLMYFQNATSCLLMMGTSANISTTEMGTQNVRHKIDLTANNGTFNYTINGATKSGTYNGQFPHTSTLGIMCSSREGGSYVEKIAARVYSCQIYDNDTLVRDYIPCINPSGVGGLYDLVNAKFYGNSGTGVFAVGRNVYSEDEITKLEYVESNGTQYVDTEFKPNQDTRIIMDAQLTSDAMSQFMFGCRTSSYTVNYSVLTSSGALSSRYGSSSVNFTGLAFTDRYKIDKNKNICTLNGTALTNTESTFQSEFNLFLFACNEGGTAKYFGNIKMYLCQLYDNGTLIREYHPATVNGEVGLWDACSGVLYTSGSDTSLIAGPEIETAPSTPSALEILQHTDTSVTLGWNEVANAFGYRVYKNGGLYAEQTATEFSDEVTPYQSIEYGVSAYNDKGESKTALLVVYISPDNPIPYLITDRKQADADRVAALALMDYESMSDTERAEWDSGLKGAYNASDLNRVESAVAYLDEALRVLPVELREYAANLDVAWDEYFDVPYEPNAYEVSTKQDWTMKDIPTPADMDRYLANVIKLRNALQFASDALPQTMNDLRWQGANAIESALKNLDTAIALFKENTQIMIVNTAAAWAYSGEVFMGEA